ncbi:hypothetical protein Vretifemale_14565, partial [Volvox reticuliferus]
MLLQAFAARNSEEGSTRSRSGHVSGRVVSGITAVTGPSEDPDKTARRRTGEQYEGLSGPGAPASAGSGPSRRAAVSSMGPLSSEDSYEEAPPRRRPQPINAELVKLVASFAPLELAQLKAAEQKARIKKVKAPAAAVVEPVDLAADGAADYAIVSEADAMEYAGSNPAVPPPAEQRLEPARPLVRPSTADAARAPGPPMAAPGGRLRSQSASRQTHLPAAPPKGAVIKRDPSILPNPVAQKQTEAMQRQAAVTAFVKRLQREQDLLRAEKERRLKAEQDALAAQLDEETREARAAAADVARVPEVQPVPVRRKKSAQPSSGINAALKDMQATVTGQDAPEKKVIDPRPWRHNMRKHKNQPVSGEAPVGAPREVPAKAATGAPPPRNVSPGAAGARAKTLDPVARSQLKDYIERKAKERTAKQQQEKAAQLEAKTAQLKVLKAEMAKARERAQKYAETSKENPPEFKAPRPAWVDIAPEQDNSAAAAQPAAARLQRPAGGEPDFDLVSERAMPYHMGDAMRMEMSQQRRQERRAGSAPLDHSRGGRPVLVDNFGHVIGGDGWDIGPQVVRVHDPDVSEQYVRMYRSSSAHPSRTQTNDAVSAAQAVARQTQVGYPVGPEAKRA